jgi:hypothetical protein
VRSPPAVDIPVPVGDALESIRALGTVVEDAEPMINELEGKLPSEV